MRRIVVGVLFCGIGIGSFGWGRTPKQAEGVKGRVAWGAEALQLAVQLFKRNHPGARAPTRDDMISRFCADASG